VRKIIAILITLTMLFSVLSIMPAFAYTGYETVWTQNFDVESELNDKFAGVVVANTVEFNTTNGKDGSGCIALYKNATNNNCGAKIRVDNSILENGKTYRFKADVFVDLNASTDVDKKQIKIGYLNGWKGTVLSQSVTSCKAGNWTTIYSEEFVYNASAADATDGINVRIDGTTYDISGENKDILYIDNLAVEEVVTDYFKNTKGEKVSTTADAGYYADTFDADVKTGAISFDAYISDNDDDVASYDSFGMYVYRLGYEDGKQSVFATGDDAKNSLKDANGLINVLVEEIGEEYFGEKILVVPYVVVDGETYLGEVFTYSVNDAGENLKWLGAKGE